MSEPKSGAIHFSLEGDALAGQEGDTLAAALLRNRVTTFTRSIKYHRPRGPFCLAGSCGQCLVRVNGVPSLPACRIALREGMRCERQNAPLGLIDTDLFRAVDFIYRGGLDHHHLMIQSRLLGRVALEVARRLAGLGTLPDQRQPAQTGSARTVPLAIIGAGPAGLAAARGALSAGLPEGVAGLVPLLIEREEEAGGAGRLWSADGMDANELATDPERGRAQPLAAAPAKGVELMLGAEVVGLYADPQPDGDALIAVRKREGLLAVRARRVVIATGGASQPLPFAGNDRPGVYAARGLIELQRRCGVRVGEGAPLLLAGSGEDLVRCARALVTAGYPLAGMVVIDNHSSATYSSDSSTMESLGKDALDLLPPGVELFYGELLRARGRPVAEVQIAVHAVDDPKRRARELALSDAKLDTGKRQVRKIRCGALALALPPAPLHDLASSAGARAELSQDQSGFPLLVDDSGRTSLPWLFACGTVAGRSLTSLEPKSGAADLAGAEQLASRAGAQAAREAAISSPTDLHHQARGGESAGGLEASRGAT